MSAVTDERFDEYTEEERRYIEAEQLVAALRWKGVSLWLAGDKVRFKPADALSDHAVSELRRCKAEVVEILEDEAAHEAWMAAAPEFNRYADYDAFHHTREQAELNELPVEKREALLRWIADNIWPSSEETERRLHDSYQLKHWFERSPEGSYITDAQFRAAMTLSGFPGRRFRGLRYRSCESRYYYVQPNHARAIEILREDGMQYEWAVSTVIDSHADEGLEV